MTFPAQDRLVRKEVALGTLREWQPPQSHIGLSMIAPWQEVSSDDVIFDFAKPITDGLAPARAEDAESELAQKDTIYGGTGRAAVIDWSLKDHYTASDVTRYRETLLIQGQTSGVNGLNLPLTVGNMIEDFRAKVARDDLLRKKKLDNRIEWLIMTALETGGITYNDGKIKFTVDYGRPANQTDEATATAQYWSAAAADPIADIIAVQEFMWDTYGVHMTKAICSRKALMNVLNSTKFIARTGLISGTGTDPVDPRYLIDGWGPEAAMAIVERATGVQFTVYDSVYRTRTVGSTTVTNNRFLSEDKVIFLPDPNDVADLDDAIGFAKTLTSPHPEGNWQPGFYEWEQETTDPWGTNRGTGIKAFPVFPHLDLTYTMKVLA